MITILILQFSKIIVAVILGVVVLWGVVYVVCDAALTAWFKNKRWHKVFMQKVEKNK